MSIRSGPLGPISSRSADTLSVAAPVQPDVQGGDVHPPDLTRPSPRDNGVPHAPGAEHGEVLTSDLPTVGTARVLLMAGVCAGALAALFLLGYFPHRVREAQARADAAVAHDAVPVVSVMEPQRQARASDVVLPGDIQALQVTAIYARANGYLKRLLVDIGDHVDAGQLLAEIDTPEIDAQLAQARANADQARASLAKAQSDSALAKLTLDRYQSVADTRAVSLQDLDDKRAQYVQAQASVEVAKAAITSAEDEVQRLTVLQGFERVSAPFAGTVTVRNYDLGALLAPTNTGDGKELFQLARTDVLRVFTNVPQSYATDLQDGQPAELLVRNYPGRVFAGKVVRSSGAVNATTRTLRIEVDVPNSDHALLAGMYGEVCFHITAPDPPLLVPASALVYNADGLSVAVVNQGKVHFQKIAIARDLGSELEIADGLRDGQAIVSNPGERLREGLAVRAVAAPTPARPAAPQSAAR